VSATGLLQQCGLVAHEPVNVCGNAQWGFAAESWADSSSVRCSSQCESSRGPDAASCYFVSELWLPSQHCIVIPLDARPLAWMFGQALLFPLRAENADSFWWAVECCLKPGRAGSYLVVTLNCLLCDWLVSRCCRSGQANDYQLVGWWHCMERYVYSLLSFDSGVSCCLDRWKEWFIEQREDGQLLYGKAVSAHVGCSHKNTLHGKSLMVCIIPKLVYVSVWYRPIEFSLDALYFAGLFIKYLKVSLSYFVTTSSIC